MIKPANPSAEQVEYLQSVNLDIDQQIAALKDRQKANDDLILHLSEIAVWEDVEDEQDMWEEQVNDLSPYSPDAPENAKVIENPVR